MKPKNLVIARAVREQGLTHAEAATRYGVTRQWVHTLLARYDTEGPAGLEPRSRAPKTRPGTTPPAVTERIIELRRELTAAGADAGPITIAWHLERDGHLAPSTSTIRRTLHTAGLITPAPNKRPRSSYIRFEADLPNECWQADITHWNLANGTRIEILDFLDDHARFLLQIHAATAFTGADVTTAMSHLISTYGPPYSTLTDNGLVFTTRLARHKGARGGFEKLLTAHGIIQKNGSPGHPQTQGKIERFHQTLKRWLTARRLPDTTEQLQTMLNEFRTWYNTARPHRSIGRRTPERAYTALPKATPTHTPQPEWRTRTDRVDKNGKISLRYAGQLRHLGIGRAHIGTPVLILIHDRNTTVSNADTGQIIAEHTIDPTKHYQPKKR
ncbi:transposase [Saccharomonospora marina XMU15]|uniref:Transposase n=1 Tax=Saccharomonospora marina XMU15 TaxID=882083 RepID=H5X3H6_9PSEU|nr:transposase [Saccharomonospora marina XMU15]EHR49910.1 transposase [Saccharomonospora marina XMU15]EHR51377.1 transposase [Saccharomonospora marina XMU15]